MEYHSPLATASLAFATFVATPINVGFLLLLLTAPQLRKGSAACIAVCAGANMVAIFSYVSAWAVALFAGQTANRWTADIASSFLFNVADGVSNWAIAGMFGYSLMKANQKPVPNVWSHRVPGLAVYTGLVSILVVVSELPNLALEAGFRDNETETSAVKTDFINSKTTPNSLHVNLAKYASMTVKQLVPLVSVAILAPVVIAKVQKLRVKGQVKLRWRGREPNKVAELCLVAGVFLGTLAPHLVLTGLTGVVGKNGQMCVISRFLTIVKMAGVVLAFSATSWDLAKSVKPMRMVWMAKGIGYPTISRPMQSVAKWKSIDSVNCFDVVHKAMKMSCCGIKKKNTATPV